MKSPVSSGNSTLALLTTVLWLFCAGVSLTGFAIAYARPQPAPAVEPIPAEMLNVELTSELSLPDDLPPPPANDLAAIPPPDALLQPSVSQPIAVAAPSPAIAFAVSVKAPARVVSAREASYSNFDTKQTVAAPSAPALPAQTLTYGSGEGKQPAPEYPRQAVREGQEGTVRVRFIVGESGRVTSAEAISPSPWPLLNEAALRVIRNQWKFPGGKLRAYEIAIHFELKK